MAHSVISLNFAHSVKCVLTPLPPICSFARAIPAFTVEHLRCLETIETVFIRQPWNKKFTAKNTKLYV